MKKKIAPKFVKLTVQEDVLIGRVLVESGDTVYVLPKKEVKPSKVSKKREARIALLKKLLKEEEEGDTEKETGDEEEFSFDDSEFADEQEDSDEGSEENEDEAGEDEESEDEGSEDEESEEESEDEEDSEESEDEMSDSEEDSEEDDFSDEDIDEMSESIRKRLARMGSRR